MEQSQLVQRINDLLNQRRAMLVPPTESALADDLNVTTKTLSLWRRGLTIGKSARAFLVLAENTKQTEKV